MCLGIAIPFAVTVTTTTTTLSLAAVLVVALGAFRLADSLGWLDIVFFLVLFHVDDDIVVLFDRDGRKLHQAFDLDRVLDGFAAIDRKMG
ncbi:hypothetical protein D3C80_1101970 [compost metagenome]